MDKIKSRRSQYHNKKLLWIAGGIGFLGNLAANFIWSTGNQEIKIWIGVISLIGLLLLFWGLSKGYGKLD